MRVAVELYEYEESISKELQDNVNEILFGVFYAEDSEFVRGKGKVNANTLKTLCKRRLTHIVQGLEKKDNFKLKEVALTDFFVNGPRIEVGVRGKSEEEVI